MAKKVLPMRTYRANIRKAHETYVALRAAAELDTRGYHGSTALYAALDALRRTADSMAALACRECSEYGYVIKNPDQYVSITCLHPNVPRYDIKTGEQKS